jgi:L-aminopeptidase/D-esterase-like protein
VGTFVHANFGARHELRLAGVPLGDVLPQDDPLSQWSSAPPGSGSIVAVVGTDAPLLPNQCKAFARRVTLGLARTGTCGSHFSGDLFLAFSVANPNAFTPGSASFRGAPPAGYDQLRFVPWGYLDHFFAAVVQAVEEAVVNSLVANEEMTGRNGHRSPALPHDKVRRLLRARNAPTVAD